MSKQQVLSKCMPPSLTTTMWPSETGSDYAPHAWQHAFEVHHYLCLVLRSFTFMMRHLSILSFHLIRV
jgi:hypothetical protein